MTSHLRNLLLSATVALAACASETPERADPSDDPRVGEPLGNLCFSRAINGFGQWDQGKGAILTRGVNDQFLVTFAGPCLPLDEAQAVGIGAGLGGTGCLTRGDQLYFSRSPAGFRGTSPFDQGFCRIVDIYTYDADAGAPEKNEEDE